MSSHTLSRLLLAGLALAAAGCFPNPPGLCKTQADCKEGTTCVLAAGATEGLCEKNTTITCDRNCGDGFTCIVTEAGVQTCDLAEGETLSVTVTAPAGGTVLPARNVDLACDAVGKQVFEATFVLDGPGVAEVQRIAGVRGEGSTFTASWDTGASSVTEGAWTVGCEAKAGPSDASITRSASAVAVQVDKAGPTITHDAPTAWKKRDSTVELTAQVADGIAGVKADSLFVKFGETRVAATSFTGGVATFNVALADVTSETVQGPVSYVIEAADVVSNATTTSNFSLNVDAIGPVVTPAPDTLWNARGATIPAQASVTTSGAALDVSTVRVELASDSNVRVAATGAGPYTAQVVGSTVSTADTEGEVALVWVASDQAGNETRVPFTTRIDGKKPEITVPSGSTYFKAGTNADLTLTITDGGAGVNDSSVTVTYPGGSAGCPRIAAGQYQCVFAVGNSASVSVTFTAKDNVLNERARGETLQIDGTAPTATSASDSAFYGATANLVIDATISDTQSGVSATVLPTLRFDLPGSPTITGVDQGGNTWRFSTTTAAVLAGLTDVTLVDVPGTIVAQDRVGNIATLTNVVRRSFDVQRPQVATPVVTYPTSPIAASTLLRREVDPARIAGVRRDRATVRATVTDLGTNNQAQNVGLGAGVDSATVRLTYTKTDGTQASIAASNVTGDEYTFTFDASDVLMANTNVNGSPLNETYAAPLQVVASDRNGNAAAPGAVAATITRRLWEVTTNAFGRPVIGAVAIDAGSVYAILDDSGRANVFALNRATGATTWSGTAPGTPKTPPVLGTGRVYLTSENNAVANHVGFATGGTGTVAPLFECALSGTSSGPPALARTRWRTDPSDTDILVSATSEISVWASRYLSSCDTRDSAFGVGNASNSSMSLSGNTLLAGNAVSRVGKASVAFSTGSFLTAVVTSGGPTAVHPVPGAPVSSNGNVLMLGGGRLYSHTPDLAGSTNSAASLIGGALSSQLTIWGPNSVVAPAGENGLIGYQLDVTTPFAQIIPRNGATALTVSATPALGKTAGLNDVAYFGTTSGRVVAGSLVNSTQLWNYTSNGAIASPKLSCNGVLYGGTSTGRVFALITDSTGPAETPWPTFQHDNRNTGNTATPIYTGGVCQE